MRRIDHLILGSQDLDRTCARLRADLGLGWYGDSTFPDGSGLGNRIVPLGIHFIEIMGVLDAGAAARHPFGGWLQCATEGGDVLLGWSVLTDDLEGVGDRLRLRVLSGWHERVGERIAWRTVGAMEALAREPYLPMFVDYEDPEAVRRAQTLCGERAEHASEPVGIGWIEVSGDPKRLSDWIGENGIPVRCEPGPPAVRAAGIMTMSGELVLR